jgi:hypothetical protein
MNEAKIPECTASTANFSVYMGLVLGAEMGVSVQPMQLSDYVRDLWSLAMRTPGLSTSQFS